MRKAEHQLLLSFDPEYQEKHKAWRNTLQMFIRIEVEYLANPKKYMLNLFRLTVMLIFFFTMISSGRLWWLGIPTGIVLTILISLGVTVHMLWEERRELGLDIVWPW